MNRPQLYCVVVVSLVMTATVWGGGPYFRMVPVQPQGADADPYPVGTTIDEQAGTISFPGLGPQRVWIEVRYGGWGGSADSMQWYQFATAFFPAVTCGLLQKAIEPCTPGGPGEDDRCRGLFGEGPAGGPTNPTGCRGNASPPGACIMAFPQWVGGDFRADYVTELSIFAADVSTDRIRFGQARNSGDSCVVDDLTEKYAATLVVETTVAVLAPGDIPVDFDLSPMQSFLGDCDSINVPISTFSGAVIQFRGDQCASDEHCDDDDPCTNDTCDLGTGQCAYAPIPNCPAPERRFSYQGFLENPPGTPVTDTCDFRFGLWGEEVGGSPITVTFPHENPLTLTNVDVFNGAFSTILDYGTSIFDGDPRWLTIEVQCPGDPLFVLLSPRVPLLPTPYALRALDGVGPPNGLYVTEAGDVGIGLSDPVHPLELASGAHVTTGGMWTNASSRSLKENFADVNPLDVLSRLVRLPIQIWNYRNEDDAIRHLAPTAEDFYGAFALGGSSASIGTIDADGVALAAIQGLHEIVQERECEIEELRERNRTLEERIEAIEKALGDVRRGGAGEVAR